MFKALVKIQLNPPVRPLPGWCQHRRQSPGRVAFSLSRQPYDPDVSTFSVGDRSATEVLPFRSQCLAGTRSPNLSHCTSSLLIREPARTRVREQPVRSLCLERNQCPPLAQSCFEPMPRSTPSILARSRRCGTFEGSIPPLLFRSLAGGLHKISIGILFSLLRAILTPFLLSHVKAFDCWWKL